ncbi:hypothetical protein RHSIM_Rhsim12G0113200 [Rhododendron simsii]|uniref:Uncharacterized protein n=1 Tax=Rhododendron simsii TaxID=118357 RepID=A0A834LAB0_RHOSS|nr:hypothetical protein RHSIM_Rhsim12G0113200 [Rhododendron simsii]
MFDKSQPLKKNASEKPTMEAERKRAIVMATLSNENQLKFNSAEGRIGLVLDLIMFEGNSVKEKIMEKAKKKYPSPKGKR